MGEMRNADGAASGTCHRYWMQREGKTRQPLLGTDTMHTVCSVRRLFLREKQGNGGSWERHVLLIR